MPVTGPPPRKVFKKLKREIPLYMRAALERTFWVWLRVYGPKRFTRKAIREFRETGKSYKKDYTGFSFSYENMFLRILSANIKKGKDTANPLEKSGTLKREFLNGSIRFTGGRRSGNLTATWTSLPDGPFKGSKTDKIDVEKALLEFPDNEIDAIQSIFDKFLQKAIDQGDKRFTFGVQVIQI